MKTAELTGAALDWAVAKCEGLRTYIEVVEGFKPSTDWAQGGPIIEREQISLVCMGDCLEATYSPHTAPVYGETPLIAAMRCYVANKLGEDVDIPEELT